MYQRATCRYHVLYIAVAAIEPPLTPRDLQHCKSCGIKDTAKNWMLDNKYSGPIRL